MVDENTFQEFTLPYEHGDDSYLSYLVIDFQCRGRFLDTIQPYLDNDEHPPSTEDACADVAEDFEENFDEYYTEEIIRDADDQDNGITDKGDLLQELKAGSIRFIF